MYIGLANVFTPFSILNYNINAAPAIYQIIIALGWHSRDSARADSASLLTDINVKHFKQFADKNITYESVCVADE